MMDFIEIHGFKSIKSAVIELGPVNVLIGANGAGKSNFIQFFEFLNALYEQKMNEYVALNGGPNKFLHKGQKVTETISAKLSFDDEENSYRFTLNLGNDTFVVVKEQLRVEGKLQNISRNKKEAGLKYSDDLQAKDIQEYLRGLKKYHFHDTGKVSPFNGSFHKDNDAYFLYKNGGNLAAFLYNIQTEHPEAYQQILQMIQSIAPYFSDFFFQANQEGYLRLAWRSKFDEQIYGATDLSDGTIRFIALATLFFQPNLPRTIIIDEPELGLHPMAITKLAGMVYSAAEKGCQVILTAQSSDLLNHFEPQDILTVAHYDGETVFERLYPETMETWMEDYILGDSWKQWISYTK